MQVVHIAPESPVHFTPERSYRNWLKALRANLIGGKQADKRGYQETYRSERWRPFCLPQLYNSPLLFFAKSMTARLFLKACSGAIPASAINAELRATLVRLAGTPVRALCLHTEPRLATELTVLMVDLR